MLKADKVEEPTVQAHLVDERRGVGDIFFYLKTNFFSCW